MKTTHGRVWRTVAFAAIACAIAHCGDGNNNDNTTPGATRTPTNGATPTRTPTSAVTATTAGTSPTVASTTGGGTSPTVTATPPPTEGACPSAISFEGNSDTARLDSGWTGSGHEATIISNGKITVSTDCGGHPRPCGTCNVTGPIANPDVNAGTSDNQRCTNNTATTCTDNSKCSQQCVGGSNDGAACTSAGDCPNGTCPAAGTCAFFFGAPLPLSAGAVSTCIINQVTGSVTGTANIETGESTSTVHLTSSVFSAPILDIPCPVCNGDTTIADGQKNGTCSDGARVGLSCDVGGVSKTFEPTGKTSFDCPPLAGGKIGALPIILANSTSTTTKTLSADSPDCGGDPGKKCFCDTCTTPAAEPCSTNADCPSGAACGGRRCRGGTNNGKPCAVSADCGGGACSSVGQPPEPNACLNGTACVPVNGIPNSGECASGPFDVFCSPHEIFRGCDNNDNCKFPGDTCTGGKFRPCFLDNGAVGGSVSATGVADPPVNGVAHPTLSALFCIPPTSATAVNSAAGLPGLGRLQLPGTATEVP